MRFLIGLILLAFPILEIVLLFSLAQRYGFWLLVYLVVISYLGLQLIRSERQMVSAKMMQSLKMQGNPMKAILGSARNMFAGFLLLIPGVITDVMAAILLLIPIQQPKVNVNQEAGQQADFESNFDTHYKRGRQQGRHEAANDDVIEGEYVEIKEQTDRLNEPSDNNSPEK
jgi:UPF0716 protein FxsA